MPNQLIAQEDYAKTQAEFLKQDTRMRAKLVVGACWISVVGMALGVTLDLSLYPQLFPVMVSIRLAVELILIAIILLMRVPWLRERRGLVSTMAIVMAVVMNSSFSLMMFCADGVKSPYYLGMVLVFLVMAALLMWSPWECALMCFLSVVSYAIACILNRTVWEEEAWAQYAFNVAFLVVASGVCVLVAYHGGRLRREEFFLRHRLDRQNRALQDLDRLKTEFFSNVSHELRTPLTCILGPIDLIKGDGAALSPGTVEQLDIIQRNAFRLLKLVNDLLELMRLDQGSENLQITKFPAKPFLFGLVRGIQPLAKQASLQIDLICDEGEITADAPKLEKVVLNLLTNAIKFTPAGGRIVLSGQSFDNGYRLVVRDNGRGIPEVDLPHIFDRFHQVRGGNGYQGIGIGLALVKQLVEGHGGRISVISEVGIGTEFRVELPQHDDVPILAPLNGDVEPVSTAFRAADRIVRFIGQEPEERVVGAGEQTILVVDDEDDMRRYIVSVLQDEYRIIQTASGQKALDVLEREKPALAVIDYMMPGMDGVELCRRIRENPKFENFRILVLTARNDESSKVTALEAGATDYLTKPFSALELRARIRNHMGAALNERKLKEQFEELQRIHEKLKRMRAQIVQSEQMNALGALSAGLLHEINNPLNITLTALEFAMNQRAMDPTELKEVLEDVRSGMERIRDVIQRLKSFAFHDPMAPPRSVPLMEPIAEAAGLITIDINTVTFETDVPESLTVVCRKPQMMLLFCNLFGNSIKAFPKAKPRAEKRIRVAARKLEDVTEITVSDNADGMPDDVKARAFEPFFSTRRGGHGLGMGLSICQGVVNSMGGTIELSDNYPSGTVVTIRIPNIPEPTDTHEAVARVEES
jgi:Signal transduction histidine kinase